MKKILLIILLAASSSAFCSNWRFMAHGANGVKLYMDMDSIKKVNDSKVFFWAKTVFPDTQLLNSIHYDTMMTRYEFDCINDRNRAIQVNVYLKGQKVFQESKVEDWHLTAPDTVSDDHAKLACSHIR